MSIGYNPDNVDIANRELLTGSLSVSTTPAQAKVGVSALEGRQFLIIYNPRGNPPIYYGGPSVTSSTGIRLSAGEVQTFPYGDRIALYLVTDSGTATAVIHECA